MDSDNDIVRKAMEEGDKEIPLSVIEFTYYSLQDDGLQLQNELYRRILDEGMQHIHDKGFVAERYFLNHPDPQISGTAFELSIDKEQLSRYHGDVELENPLASIPRLIATLKLRVVREDLKRLTEKAKDPALRSDKEAFRALMDEFKAKTQRAGELAKESGDRVVLR